MATTKFNLEMLDKPCSELGVTAEELKSIIASAKEAIASLDSKDKLTAKEQEIRADIVDFIHEAVEYYKTMPKGQTAEGYTVKPGTEQCVHLRLRYGKRFDSSTGKEISPEYIQMLSYAEWQLFKVHHISLGYRIVEVLHDPYGDAKKD